MKQRLLQFVFLLLVVTKGWGYAEIGNLPATATVKEVVSGATFLFSVVANPSAATCTISTGNTGSNFQISKVNDYWDVSTVASPTFVHATTPSYSLAIACTNSGVTDTQTLTVTVLQNTAPTFSNIPGTASISAKQVNVGQAIFTVSYTDADGDSLTYNSFTTTPASGPFSMSSGFVQVTVDLTDHEVSPYVLEFCASDGINDVCGLQVTVTITDINNRPVILQLDETIQRPEITTRGRLLVYTVQYTDGDNDNVTFSIYNNVWVPATANTFFELIESTGELYLLEGKELDYETQTSYTFNVVVADEIHSMTDPFKTLTLEVINTNEGPYFTGSPSGVTIPEDASGATVGIPDQLCLDADNDVLSYSIIFNETYSTYFAMASATAIVTLTQTWDYDDATLPKTFTLFIRCTDPSGVYADETYTVTFTDVNDNDPVCSPSVTSLSLSYATAASETFLNLQCSDIDSGVNADLLYTMAGVSDGYGVTKFQSDTSGNVSLMSTLSMDFPTDFYVTIFVTDQGTPARSTSVSISVTYTEAPPVDTEEEINPCFLCTTVSVTLLSGLGLVVLGLLVLGIVLVVLRCSYYCERREIFKVLKRRPPKQPKPNAESEYAKRLEERRFEQRTPVTQISLRTSFVSGTFEPSGAGSVPKSGR